MEPRLPAIHDEDLSRDAPRMRYLVAERLEVLARMSALYRLEAPASAPVAEIAPADTARMVETRLKELEARLRPPA
jgi:hypothetical protein